MALASQSSKKRAETSSPPFVCVDAFDCDFGGARRTVAIGNFAEVGEEAFVILAGFCFGAQGVEEDVAGVFVDAKQEMNVSADRFFEWSGKVSKDAFAWSRGCLAAWLIVW